MFLRDLSVLCLERSLCEMREWREGAWRGQDCQDRTFSLFLSMHGRYQQRITIYYVFRGLVGKREQALSRL